MKKTLTALLLICRTSFVAAEPAVWENWANWQARLDAAFERVSARKLPGRTMGIVVPNDTRLDLLPLTAFGWDAVAGNVEDTVVIMMPAPPGMELNGLAVPALDELDTSFGRFSIDAVLADRLLSSGMPVRTESAAFAPELPRLLEIQLASLKYQAKGRLVRIRVLPIFVRLADVNEQAKDIAPGIAEIIKELDMAGRVTVVVCANMTRSTSEEKLIRADAAWLKAVRALDADAMMAVNTSNPPPAAEVSTPDMSTMVLGLLTLRVMGADHAEILAYSHSGQLVLTKDKSVRLSYAAAGVSSASLIPVKLQHIKREKMVDTFDELLRADILTITRQTCASILDPTAAKPPSLIHREAARPWPVYVTLYDETGSLAGQAGSHVPVGPLEESLRRFAFEAVQQAKPRLTRENFAKYVVDVSIPYGFSTVDRPEQMLPFLNGAIMHNGEKTSAWHPDAWRVYPDAHQILSEISARLGLRPWTYANGSARVETFRVLAFNEKEPFQDLGAASRKKKKKANPEESLDLPADGGGGGFTF